MPSRNYTVTEAKAIIQEATCSAYQVHFLFDQLGMTDQEDVKIQAYISLLEKLQDKVEEADRKEKPF